MKTNIIILAMFLLLVGFGCGIACGQENNLSAEKSSDSAVINIVRGKVEFSEDVKIDPSGQKTVEDEFTVFLGNLTGELKKITASNPPQCDYTVTIGLRVKSKWQTLDINIRPKVSSINVYQFNDRYMTKNSQDEKLYQEYISNLAKKVLIYINMK